MKERCPGHTEPSIAALPDRIAPYIQRAAEGRTEVVNKQTLHTLMKTKPIALLTAFLLAGASLLSAADEKKTSLTNQEESFLKEQAQTGMAEVQVAELGARKAARADVKAFAEMMAKDHAAANLEIKTLAASKGVEVSAIIDPDAADKMKNLENKATGNDFDKDFLDEMEKDHKKTIDAFEELEKDAKDADLKAWVTKTLPNLRAHLDHVKELKSK